MRTGKKTAPTPPSPGKDDLASSSALAAWYLRGGLPFPESEAHERLTHNSPGRIGRAVWEGTKKFAQIKVPVLAICAYPQDVSAQLRSFTNPEQRAKVEALLAVMNPMMEKQIAAFRKGVPGARVVVLSNAHHYVFLSNEADVLREVKAFVETLP